MQMAFLLVLIESDWNLKSLRHLLSAVLIFRINRIRLEFKDDNPSILHCKNIRINRIRLEFKGRTMHWTLTSRTSINRIRLEFKEARE